MYVGTPSMLRTSLNQEVPRPKQPAFPSASLAVRAVRVVVTVWIRKVQVWVVLVMLQRTGNTYESFPNKIVFRKAIRASNSSPQRGE